jgi:hypothetical protein
MEKRLSLSRFRATKAWCWYCGEVMYFAPDDPLRTTDAEHPETVRILNPEADMDQRALVHMRCHLEASPAERQDAMTRLDAEIARITRADDDPR